MKNTITPDQFNALNDLQKTQLLGAGGEFLDITRITAPFKINLYSLNDFYVEVYYHQNSDKIAILNAFTSNRRLDRYLPFVDISEALTVLKLL